MHVLCLFFGGGEHLRTNDRCDGSGGGVWDVAAREGAASRNACATACAWGRQPCPRSRFDGHAGHQPGQSTRCLKKSRVYVSEFTLIQVSIQTEQLKLLNFRDFDVAGSYFNPPPPPKQQVDIYVTPEGDVRSVIFSGNIPS